MEIRFNLNLLWGHRDWIQQKRKYGISFVTLKNRVFIGVKLPIPKQEIENRKNAGLKWIESIR